MFPILRPGSLVLIDDKRRRIARGGWTTEFDRPVYFLEHRDRFLCGWCTVARKLSSTTPSLIAEEPGDFQIPQGD
jgi:hypothetical protein